MLLLGEANFIFKSVVQKTTTINKYTSQAHLDWEEIHALKQYACNWHPHMHARCVVYILTSLSALTVTQKGAYTLINEAGFSAIPAILFMAAERCDSAAWLVAEPVGHKKTEFSSFESIMLQNEIF